MAERRGRPWAAWGVVVVTLGLTVLLGGGGAFAVVFSACFMQDCSVGDWLPGVLFFSAAAAAGLAFGLVQAWKVGTGRARDPEWDPVGVRSPVESGPAWLVAEPGAETTRFIMGDERAGFLIAGTPVKEVRRTGSRVLVTGPDGVAGWVDGDRLAPPGEGEAEGGS